MARITIAAASGLATTMPTDCYSAIKAASKTLSVALPRVPPVTPEVALAQRQARGMGTLTQLSAWAQRTYWMKGGWDTDKGQVSKDHPQVSRLVKGAPRRLSLWQGVQSGH